MLNIRACEAAPASVQVVINWYRSSDFDGDGSGRRGPYGDGDVLFLEKDDKIRLEVTSSLPKNPKRGAADYFVMLGMTCGPPAMISMLGATRARCEIELPVRVVCRPSYVARPLSSAPIPEQSQKPLDAVLHVSVDVSAKGRDWRLFTRLPPFHEVIFAATGGRTDPPEQRPADTERRLF